MDLRRGTVIQALMKALLIIENKIAAQSSEQGQSGGKEKSRKRRYATVALGLSSPAKMEVIDRIYANSGGIVLRQGGAGVATGK